MSDTFKDMEAAVPVLTLDPFGAEDTKVPPAESKEKAVVVEEMVQKSRLSEAEQKMVDDFANQIDLTNSNVILQYGAGAQKKLADFSASALENVKNQELGEVGDMLSQVVVEHLVYIII